jgi:uncharacterized membrane protein
MSTIEEAVEVEVPVRVAYNQWTQFEEFPQFMEGIDTVKQLDDATLHWEASIGGVHKEWDAKITQQERDRLVSWENFDGASNAGEVSFEPISESSTRVCLRLDVQPEGVVENIGDKLGVTKRRVKGDLDRFKEFIESRGTETGGWRGEISDGTTF